VSAAPTRLGRLTGSVRFRLTALATVIVAVVLLGVALALATVQTDLLVDQLDDRLTQRADDLASLVRAGSLPEVLGGVGDDTVSQIVAPDGRVLAASPALDGYAAIVDPDEPLRTRPRNAALPIDDDTFRVASRYAFSNQNASGDRDRTSIHVASELSDVREGASRLTRTLATIIPVIVALFAWLAWWLTGRTLRPVEAIRSQVADISTSELHRRVPEPAGDDEIADLARTMNEMLDRLQDGVLRQQRFVADASHELRSPLTRIRSEIEVDLAHPDAADPLETLRSVLQEAVALQQLLDDLLLLARADAGGSARRDEVVEVDEIVLRLARRARDGQRVTIDTSQVGAASVHGDARQLERALANVIDNATRHAATRMELAVETVGGAVRVAVSDDGPGIPASEHERVFDRFTRLDPARDATTGGTGLGLAIARDIVIRHRGTIEFDPTSSAGARCVISLPRPTTGD